MFLDFDWMSLCFICSYISANYWAQTGVSLLNNSKCKYMKPIHAVGFKKKIGPSYFSVFTHLLV